MSQNEFELAIIGAGAAGLGAAEVARAHHVSHVVLEASHRKGGRGLTETFDGFAVDLGCHWMHSASLNPYVESADAFGLEYATRRPPRRHISPAHEFTARECAEVENDYAEAQRRMRDAYAKRIDKSIWDCLSESRFPDWLGYWFSIMHSNDADEVSLADVCAYRDTGEDWPLKHGYGALICRRGESCAVELNTAVNAVEWGGNARAKVKLQTQRGAIYADKVIVTVSTGILAANDIRFTPELPDWKRRAIDNLPMGNYNNLFFSLQPGALGEDEQQIAWHNESHSLFIIVNPFQQPYLFASTGGRFAWHLEKRGERASEDFLREQLVKIFGGEIRKSLRRFKASAWGYDAWIKGAYASARPGAGDARIDMAKPVAERLYFAGEAASRDFFNTAHGALLSGQRAAMDALRDAKNA